LCPGSNRYISGALPPVSLLRNNGLRLADGTDSPASNQTLSMIGELRLLAAAAPDIPLPELLTLAAADTIETGRRPGLVRLTGLDMQKMALTDQTKSLRII
jgi:cytosine/adenosine deaminase-related metal-dependent hydrolase